jgi:hypothetical protein
MLHNIIFQDNIYQLARSIDNLYEGLLLDLSDDIFLDKAIDDLLFFDVALQKTLKLVRDNSRISDYTEIMHSLHSCEDRFIRLLDSILQGKGSMSGAFAQFLAKIQGIRNAHAALRADIGAGIRKGDAGADARDVVSRSELSELLNF